MTTTTASSPTSLPGASFRLGPVDILSDIGVITRRGIVRFVRLPQLLVFATIQPIIFLLLFTYVFGGALGGTIPPAADGEYINWLVPGLLVQNVAFGAGQTATGLTEDLANGVIDRFRSLPMARSAVLAGRTLADLARNAFVLVLMLVVAVVIGFRWQQSIWGMVAGLGLALGFALALSWGMACIGLIVKNPEAAQTAALLPVFPLVFASSVFLPTETMPSWLQVFAANQPVTVVANAARGLILGQGALEAGQTVGGQVLLAGAWIVGLLVAFVPLATRLYRDAVT